MAGWIKIHREISSHWIFKDAEKFKWWIDLLLNASFDENKVLVGDRLIELKRGQQIVSLSYLASRWGTSKRTVLKFLTLLEQDQMCNRYTHQKVTILTICNYESYQEAEKQEVTDSDTDKYPIGNRSVTELKNVEECIRNISKTNTAPACTREDDYIRRYREEGMWSEAAIILHKSIEECQCLFDRFLVEYQHNGDEHRDYSDFKRHYIQWARITIQKERQNNGNTNKQDKRRGVQVVANSVEDYQGSF